MKLKIWMGIAVCTVLFLATASYAQSNKAVTASMKSTKKQMTWTTKSPQASTYARSGAKHFMNIEMEQAYNDLSAAIKLDSNFTVALVFMANLSRGETRKAYTARALKSGANKTEGEKLFASTLDQKNKPETNRDAWAKLHTMFPDGAMINNYYVVTRATAEERFAAAEDYLKKFPDEPSMNNVIAYYYLQDKKDTAMAKKHFEKYIAMYPEGSNPYDSMAEFYLNTGDNINSEKYYRLALEKYPFLFSSLTALQKIADAKPKDEVKAQ